MAVWPCGRVAMWPCGRVAGWPCGRVAVWPGGRGRVAGWPGGRQLKKAIVTDLRQLQGSRDKKQHEPSMTTDDHPPIKV